MGSALLDSCVCCVLPASWRTSRCCLVGLPHTAPPPCLIRSQRTSHAGRSALPWYVDVYLVLSTRRLPSSPWCFIVVAGPCAATQVSSAEEMVDAVQGFATMVATRPDVALSSVTAVAFTLVNAPSNLSPLVQG